MNPGHTLLLSLLSGEMTGDINSLALYGNLVSPLSSNTHTHSLTHIDVSNGMHYLTLPQGDRVSYTR